MRIKIGTQTEIISETLTTPVVQENSRTGQIRLASESYILEFSQTETRALAEHFSQVRRGEDGRE